MTDAEHQLIVQQLIEPGASISPPADEQAQGSAMNRKTFDIVEMQSVPCKERRETVKRMVKQVLMINGVEFALFDHVDGVGEFEDSRARGLKKLGKAANEIIDGIHMRYDIVGDHEVGELALSCKAFGKSEGKKVIDGLDAHPARLLNWPSGWIDAEARNSVPYKIPQ